MSQIKEPQSIRDILKSELDIPPYQRPYKWKVPNVISLISDLYHEKDSHREDNDYRYRIGSIILHNENGRQNIVDGQQRLLTICLIIKAIAQEDLSCGISLFQKNFHNTITLDNLKFNYQAIQNYFRNRTTEDKAGLLRFMLDRCEMIVIEAGNIAEAFQLFDSQNARGKTLEPADLLKAYHLREMTDGHTKRACVQRWEDAIDRHVLHPVMSKIIFRSRRWMRRDYDSYYFSSDDIGEFKGITPDIFSKDKRTTPYMRRLYILGQLDCYAIDEPIINGKRFFDYIDHYISLCDRLFPNFDDRRLSRQDARVDGENDMRHLFRKNCHYSPHMYRTGDTHLRDALRCMLLCYYDKFGDDDYRDFFDTAYQYVYRVRTGMTHVRSESVCNYILRGKKINPEKDESAYCLPPFEWISQDTAGRPSDLMASLQIPEKKITVEDINKRVRK